jgi:hypothetical protein
MASGARPGGHFRDRAGRGNPQLVKNETGQLKAKTP